jgi:outer membrane protein OmpA-like peptidoglycan-associated protein
MRRLPVLLTTMLTLSACAATPHQTSSASAPGQTFLVFFQPWSAGLDQTAQDTISMAARAAQSYPGRPVDVAGFADPTGSAQANVDMSRTRTQVVIDQLTADGVDRARIHRTVHGPTDYTLNSLESRRVDIVVPGR